MNTLHVGRGITRGAMTVFPLWADRAGWSRYTTSAKTLDISEADNGPDVGQLMVGNHGDRPVLVLEGQLFEGGWQHRMATLSVMVGVHQRMPVDVACVEQGRWAGSTRQTSRGRRATPYLRDAVRGGGDVQRTVWSRVAEHTAGTTNDTDSFVRHLDGTTVDTSAFRALPGQVGVLIGLGGQPYVAEVFDSTITLRREFRAIIDAAALDARFAPEVATPGRRARRFLGRAELVHDRYVQGAGVAQRGVGATEHVDRVRLEWQGRDVHTRLSNVRHPMLAGVR
ncbi:ARPP-1 family domain-containing protein [Nocardioides coralli]|uniref:ARPP-1 family domain-containing protein n=1 Tax=Nocardioides coralli TaxID=2872154 RepID=UPI001CA39E48|nr:DUF6569 family protein [Nocardioides coralli]QZY29693.1 hypothetical protein K6T13_03090 [Nocardioides coralli]